MNTKVEQKPETLKIKTTVQVSENVEVELSLPFFGKSDTAVFAVYSETEMIRVWITSDNSHISITKGGTSYSKKEISQAVKITETEFEAILHKAITSLPVNPSFAPEPVLHFKPFPKEEDDNVIIDEMIERKHESQPDIDELIERLREEESL